MDIAGYWATLVAMIVGLGLADILKNAYVLIHERRRVAWDPLPILWAVVTLLLLFNYWWSVATNDDGASDVQVASAFVLRAAAPTILFLMAAGALPHAMPPEGRLDMRAEWAKARSVFFSLFAIHQCLIWILIILVRGGVVWDAPALGRTIALALVLLALFIRSRWFEWAAALAILAGLVVRMSIQAVH
jgi:hypothetical protein